GDPSGVVDSGTGETALNGSLRLESKNPRSSITGNLSLTTIDLTRSAEDEDASIAPAPKQSAPESDGPDRGGRPGWIDHPLSLAFLETFDADLVFTVGRVAAGRLQVRDIQGHALLDDGHLRLEGLHASLPGLAVMGRATVDAAAKPLSIDLALNAERVQLPQALSFLSDAPKIEGRMQAVSLVGKAQGRTPAALIGTLSAEMTAGAVELRRRGEPRVQDAELRLSGATIAVAAGASVRSRADVVIGQQALTVDLVGGPLSDLFSKGQSWPSIQCVVAGKLEGDPAEIRGEFGPLSALLAGRGLGVDLTANYREATAFVTGTVARFDELRDSKVAINASGPNSSALKPLLSEDWSNDQPFELAVLLEGGDRSLYLQDLKISSGDSDLAGDARIYFDARPRVNATLASGFIDLTPFQTGGIGPAGVKSWVETPLPFVTLQRFDADLTLKADLVTADRLQARDVYGRALLERGRLRLEHVRVSLPGAALRGHATVDITRTAPTIALSLAAQDIELPQALSFLSQPPETEGSVKTVALNMQAQGETPALLIKALHGELTADSARFRPRGQRGDKDSEISVHKPKLSVKAGQSVRLRADVRVEQRALSLDLTGGQLYDLLAKGQPWPEIKVTARGELQGEAVEVRGDVGPLSALVSGRNLRIDLSAYHPAVTASVKGRLADLDDLQGSKVVAKAAGQSLSALGPLVGLELPTDQPFDVRARLAGGDRRLDVQELRASIGDNDVRGDLRIRFGANTQVAATLSSHSIDLTPYLANGDGGPADFTASLSESLPLEHLHVLDGAVTLTADHVRIGDFGVDDASLNAVLDAGYLHLSTKAGEERLNATVVLRPTSTQWRLDLGHKGKLDLAWLIEDENASALSNLPIAIDVRLKGLGDSLQALLGSANGRVELALGAGRLNKKAADLPFGEIVLTLLDTINPASQWRPFQNLECAVLQFDVADGIATSTQGLALQTEALNVVGSGALNLRTDEIQLHFKTAKRKGFGINLLEIADKFIYITGTLREPEVAIDPGRLLIEGGAAWATGGLSLLYDQLFTRLTASSDPCATVIGRGMRLGK
ncbi:MAG: AsmA family protein, partial [Thiohalocapsa sp.]